VTLGTHLAFASVLYLGGTTLFGYKPDWIGWLLAAVASLGPDVDLPTSKIGRLFFWLSVPLERRFGHRTIFKGCLKTNLLINIDLDIDSSRFLG
jgi:inner membrane protein